VHPALLDACFQSVAAHPGVQSSGTGGLLLPLGVRRLRAYGPVNKARFCLTRVVSLDKYQQIQKVYKLLPNTMLTTTVLPAV
jgi:hypothetical protein